MEGEIGHHSEEYILPEIRADILAAVQIVNELVSVFDGPTGVAKEIFKRETSRLLPDILF